MAYEIGINCQADWIYLQFALKMDFGETIYTQSERGLIIKSERYIGFSYRFCKKNASQYACASCRALGKSRVVTFKNGRIDVRKHPEDDHHKDCRPIADVELCSQSTGESFSATLTFDPVSDPSSHDLFVGHLKHDKYGDHSKHDTSDDPKNTAEESK